MSGYQTIEALRPILHRGPPKTPVVDRALFYKPPTLRSPNAKQIAEMVALRKAGVSGPAIEAKMGFCRATVRRYTRHVVPPATGWSDGSRPSKLQAHQAKVERMRRAGFTFAEIGEEFDCAESTVRRFLKSDKPKSRAHQVSLSRIVRAARIITGLPASVIRQGNGSPTKVAFDVSRARYIVFWIACCRCGLRRCEVAERLGGFNPKTVARGIAAANEVAGRLQITDDLVFGRVVRLLWQAEWPKASA